MTPHQRRIARARLLRRDGKTYAEIRAVVGEVGDDRLKAWLAGIPRPPETRRTGKLVEERRLARRRRAAGATYDEIAFELGVSKASLSLWLRDLPVPERVRRRRVEQLRRIRGLGGRATRANAGWRMRSRQTQARTAIEAVSAHELFFVGLAIYWSEGSKDKPWQRHGRVKLTNSDADLIRIFLAWLDLLGIREDERTYRLSIHETADVAAQERWWQDQLTLDARSFRRATLKRHNPKPSRHNVGASYHGCLVVEVLRATALYDAITGWWRGLAEGVELGNLGDRRVPSGSTLPGSSKGRTASFGVAYGGSNPSPGAEGRGSSPWLPPRWWDMPPVGSELTVAADSAECP